MLVDVGPNIGNQNNQGKKNENQNASDKHQSQIFNSSNEQNNQNKQIENGIQNEQNKEEQKLNYEHNQQKQNMENDQNEQPSLQERLYIANNQLNQIDIVEGNKQQTDQNKKNQGQQFNENQDDQNQKFDPSRDLNIFEQINFDDMNINLEDINQSKQKQDVINSSNSDIGEDMQITHKQKPIQDQYISKKQNQMGLNDSAVSGFSDISSQNQLNGQIIDNMEFEENYSDEQEYLKDYQNNQKIIEQEGINQHNLQKVIAQQEQKLIQDNNLNEKNIKEFKNDIDAAHQLDLQGMDMNNGFEMIKFSGHSSNSDSQQEYASNSKYSLVSGSQEDTPQKYSSKQNIGKPQNQNNKVKNEIEIIDESQQQKKSPVKDISEKYKQIGQIGTELQVIESQSNEVSSSGCAVSGIGDKDNNQKQSNKGKSVNKLISDSQENIQMDKKFNNYTNNKQIGKNSKLKIMQDSDVSEDQIEGLNDLSIGNNIQQQKYNSQDSYQNDLQYIDILQNGFDEKQQDNFDFLDDEQSIDSNFQIEQPHEVKQKISQQLYEQDKLLEKFEQKNSKTLQMIQQEKQISNKNKSKNYDQAEQKQKIKIDQNYKKSLQFEQNLIEGQIQLKNKTQVIDFKKIRNEDQLIEQQKYDNIQYTQDMNNRKIIKNKITDSSQKVQTENVRNKSTNFQKQIFNQNQSMPDSLINTQLVDIDKIADEQLKQIQKLQNNNQYQTQKQSQNQQPIKILKKQHQISVTNKHQNQIESARQNFVSAQIPIQSLQSQNNFGNFSHRVGQSTKHQNFQQQSQYQNGQIPVSLSNYQSLQNVNSTNNGQAQSVSSTVNLQNQQTNKQLLKNLKKQIKNGNEDYYIMQNISNQMGGKLVQSSNSGIQVQNKFKNENNNLLSLSSLFYANNMNLTTSGLNTTKHNKTDKSFENLMTAFTNKKGEPIQTQIVNQENMNISGNLQANQRKQNSNDSSKPQIQINGQNIKQRNTKNQVTDQKSNPQSLGKNKSFGKQKTLSNSPKSRKPNISDIKKLLSNTTMIPNQIDTLGPNNMSYGTVQIQKGSKNKSINNINKIQNQINIVPQNGIRAQSKTHRGAGNSNLVMALGNRTGCGSSSSAVQQIANQSQSYNNPKKNQENMKDLNYLIKTLEKFSKNSVSISTSQNIQGNYTQAEIVQIQQHNSMNSVNEQSQSQKKRLVQSQNYPKIITGFQDNINNVEINERRNVFQGNGSNGSDPQTPKDIQINFGNQILNNISTENQANTLGYSQQKQYRSKSNQNSGNNNTRKNGSKSKQNSLLGNAITQQNNAIAQKNQIISQKSKSSMLGMIQVNSGSLNLQNPKNTKNLILQLELNQKLNQLKKTSDNIQNVVKNNNGFNLSHLNILLHQASNQSKNTGAPAFIINQGKNDDIDQYISIRNKMSHANTQQVQKCKKKGSSESRSHGRSGTGNTRGIFDLTPDNNFNTSGQRRKNNILTEQSNAIRKNEQNKSSKSNKNRQNEQKASYSPPQTQSNPYFENMGLGKHLIEKLQSNNQAIQLMNLVSSQRDARSVDSKGRSQSTNKSGSQNRKTSKNKKKKFSFSLNQNQPLQLNDLVYSCTQKLDMQEINRNLLMINNDKKGSGSTQNKQLNRQIDMLLPNKKTNNPRDNVGSLNLHSQREQRDRSSGSNNSKNRLRNATNNNFIKIQQQNNQQNFVNENLQQMKTQIDNNFKLQNQNAQFNKSGNKIQNNNVYNSIAMMQNQIEGNMKNKKIGLHTSPRLNIDQLNYQLIQNMSKNQGQIGTGQISQQPLIANMKAKVTSKSGTQVGIKFNQKAPQSARTGANAIQFSQKMQQFQQNL